MYPKYYLQVKNSFTTSAMSSVQQKLNHVDERSKKIVIGFMRLSEAMIPIDIINLCILFYAISESFDKHGKLLHISDSENGMKDVIVEQKTRESSQSVLASFVVDTEQLATSAIEWTFKIHPTTIKQLSRLIMYVGIVDGSEKTITNFPLDNYAFGAGKSYRNYGWRCRVRRENTMREKINQWIHQRSHTFKSDRRYQDNAAVTVFKSGDNEVNTIQLRMDIPKKSLLMIVNDKKDGIKKFENVDMTGLYRMALSMRAPCFKIEIVDFQINQQ